MCRGHSVSRLQACGRPWQQQQLLLERTRHALLPQLCWLANTPLPKNLLHPPHPPAPRLPARLLQAPLLAVVALGAYLATNLLYGVATFRTVPEEAELLQKVTTFSRGEQEGGRHRSACPQRLPLLPELRAAGSAPARLLSRLLPGLVPQDIARAKADLAKRGITF